MVRMKVGQDDIPHVVKSDPCSRETNDGVVDTID
jgi:hypothetical protein